MTIHSAAVAPYEQADSKGRGIARFLRNNGLTLAVLGLFALTVVAQVATGIRTYNQWRSDHHRPPVSLREYLTTGHFVEALGENWESEFLQMAVFVYLTACLYQKGSPESKNPDEEDAPTPITP